jgi:hypothetical protein
MNGIVFFLALAALIGQIYLYATRPRNLMQNWAEENGVQLTRVEFRPFRRGPFLWSSRGQTVFRVEVCDREGNRRSGWIRCGSMLLGVFAKQIEVKWDHQLSDIAGDRSLSPEGV